MSLFLLLLFLLIEGGSRLYIRNFFQYPEGKHTPYIGAPYFNRQFLAEVRKSRAGGDFQGKYINIKDNIRATAHQPEKPVFRIFLFGGSTALCQEVPDWLTTASHLQKMLNNAGNTNTAVVNLGVSGMPISAQHRRLLGTSIKPGDIVIFYDGANDARTIYSNALSQDKDNTLLSRPPTPRPIDDLLLKAFANHGDHIASLQFLMALRPQRLINPDSLETILHSAQKAYCEHLVSAHNFTQKHGGRFIHFLQPNLFSLSKRTPYEDWVLNNQKRFYFASDGTMAAAYETFREAIAEARGQGVVSFDLSGALDTREPGQEFYFDFCHVNHLANEKIAGLMYKALFP